MVSAGARWFDSASELAQASDVLFTSLPGPSEVEALAFGDNGVAKSMRKGSVWFDLSTNAPQTVRHLHDVLGRQEVAFLDAPVSGGVQGAIDATLGVWVGGDREQYDKHLSLLAAMGDGVTYAGPIGAGTITKLVTTASHSWFKPLSSKPSRWV